MNNILFKVRNLTGFGSGSKRSNLAKKNISASIVIKGLNIGIGLLLVPLTLNYLEPTSYGIWITLSSIIGWFGFFDIGLGNGLRNHLAKSLAEGKISLARSYVSTTYALLVIVIGIMLIFFNIVNPYISWEQILNVEKGLIEEGALNLLVLIVFTFFCLQFIFKLITTILTANQLPAIASSIDLLAKILSLIFIMILLKTTKGSLLYLGLVMSSMPLGTLFFASIWFFYGKYKFIRPSLKHVDLNKAHSLFKLGIKFFFIQIAVVLLYQTDNIIISHLFGPAQVTPYNISFKYFNLLLMGFSIIIAPFWSAFTEAWVKKDITWIKKVVNKLCWIWGILLLISFLMLLVSEWIYNIWVGNQIVIPFSMSALVSIWILINMWTSIFSQFLNGVGKIKLQIILSLFIAILNIPLAILFGSEFGINGVIAANILVVSVGAIVYPIQYLKIINNKSVGIWDN